jgi:hypothetical protein
VGMGATRRVVQALWSSEACPSGRHIHSLGVANYRYVYILYR